MTDTTPAAEAKLAKVQEALDDLTIRLGDPQRRYDKIGPTWTGKDGHEYSDMSELLDFATEISEQVAAIRALIDREPAPVVRRVRHLKRGSTYEVIGDAEGQISHSNEELGRSGQRVVAEGTVLTVYKCDKTGKLFWRFPSEFNDGRFVDE